MTGRYYASVHPVFQANTMLTAALFCLVVGISDGDTLTARCGGPGAYE